LKKYKIQEFSSQDGGSRLSLLEDERKFMSSRNSERGLNSYITLKPGNSSIRQPSSILESEGENPGKPISCEKIKKKSQAKS
jgi:hypothetical protein